MTVIASDIDTQSERRKAVERVYLDLYEAREEGSTERRKLTTNEALFVSAFDSISRKYNKDRAEARKTWGHASNAYAAVANLYYRQEAAELEEALAKYRCLCEGVEEAVSQAMAAE